MDYSVGSVAALISGNVTPNRPNIIKRALTPTKHQPSPNVTPKSEFVDDRSIFLSPSLQKKKAIIKKSPKRIFQNPDLEVTNDGETNSGLLSPKAEKVKKHLKDDLEADQTVTTSPKSPKSPKKGKGRLNKSVKIEFTEQNENCNDESVAADFQAENESTPKKKKKQRALISEPVEEEKENLDELNIKQENSKRKRKSDNVTVETVSELIESANNEERVSSPKKKKKNKKNNKNEEKVLVKQEIENEDIQIESPKKKKNENKEKKSKLYIETSTQVKKKAIKIESIKNKQKTKSMVNLNAITNKDTDSEHESDDEIESENEKINNEVLDTGPAESETSDEETTEKETKKPQKQKIEREEDSAEEVKRTIFVGNVPFSKKCKKEIKKIFSKHGDIESVRIRTVPVKDGRVTPKLAVIKNELHPERTTVNVYVKYKTADSVEKALVENNTVLNDYHLRVTRCEATEHDPRKAIFVGNLPFNIEDDTLRTKFESCGEIDSVRIIRDRKTNAGKGFGYVNFASKDSVELALSMSEEDLTIKNRILRVKRCSVHPNKPQKGIHQDNKQQFSGRNQGNQRQGTGRNQGNSERFQGNQRRNGPPGRPQGRPGQMAGRNQGNPGRNQGNSGRSQGNRGSHQGNPGRNQGIPGRGKFGGRDQVEDGAYRRIMKKRENEDNSGGPPSKRSKEIDQPAKEKKPRKEFVGMTAEKKKKRKFDKGQKKKKAISEILTKNKDSVK